MAGETRNYLTYSGSRYCKESHNAAIDSNLTASEKKLDTSNTSVDFDTVSVLDGYSLINYKQLQKLISESVVCKLCEKGEMKVFKQTSKK